jgi:hypothetical protein
LASPRSCGGFSQPLPPSRSFAAMSVEAVGRKGPIIESELFSDVTTFDDDPKGIEDQQSE